MSVWQKSKNKDTEWGVCSVHRRSRGGPCGAGNEGGAEVVGRGQIVLGLTDYHTDMAICSE